MSSRLPRSGSRLPNLSTDDLENMLDQWQDSENGYSDDDDVADPSYILELNGQNLREDTDEEPKVPNPEDQGNEIMLPNLLPRPIQRHQ